MKLVRLIGEEMAHALQLLISKEASKVEDPVLNDSPFLLRK